MLTYARASFDLCPKVGDSRFVFSIPLKINLYLSANEKIKHSPLWLRAIFKGFWLGILSRRELQIIDRIYYEQTSDYCDAHYNKSDDGYGHAVGFAV